MPSWQAQVFNLGARLLIKSMMGFGSLGAVRGMAAVVDAAGERLAPPGCRLRAVTGAPFQGEWLEPLAGGSARVLLYFPGGAFVLRTPTQHREFVARLCLAADARALIVHYRLAPERPFPSGLEDCLAAYHHLLDIGVAPADITVAGDSAGGGLALSTLLALRDEGTAMPANALLLSPLGDLTYSGGSRHFNRFRDPMLPTHRASQMHELYIGDALPEDRYLSPVLASFAGLPPLMGLVGSTEILLDDTLRAAAGAAAAGVPFVLDVWERMPHVFPLFAVLPESQVAVARMAAFIAAGTVEPLSRPLGVSSAEGVARPRGLARLLPLC